MFRRCCSELYQPGNFGFDLRFERNTLTVTKVLENFPAGLAGLRPGDQLVTVNGIAMNGFQDWAMLAAGREIGYSYDFEIVRDGELREFRIALESPGWRPRGWFELKRAVQAGLLALGIGLGFSQPRHSAALLGALLLAGIGTAPVFPESEMTAIWGEMPPLIGITLWIPQLTHLLLPPLLFTFLNLLPRPVITHRLVWLALWSPAILLACACPGFTTMSIILW